MPIRKTRWSRVYESSEEELIELLESMGITATRIHLDEFETQDTVQIDNPTTLWLAEGSMTFRADNNALSVQPGDTLHLESNVEYTAIAGMTGCAYYIA